MECGLSPRTAVSQWMTLNGKAAGLCLFGKLVQAAVWKMDGWFRVNANVITTVSSFPHKTGRGNGCLQAPPSTPLFCPLPQMTNFSFRGTGPWFCLGSPQPQVTGHSDFCLRESQPWKGGHLKTYKTSTRFSMTTLWRGTPGS